jgi:DNA-directed RNA polymerase subunit N (RpoN/RPB10)
MAIIDDTKCFLCGKKQVNRYGSVVKPGKFGIIYEGKVVDVPVCYDCGKALNNKKTSQAIKRRIKKHLELLERVV